MSVDSHPGSVQSLTSVKVKRSHRELLSMGWPQLITCLWFATMFFYFGNVHIFYSDIWGHVSYGDWILANQSLPQYDPFLSLAEGVRCIDAAWLSQIIFAKINGVWGVRGLSHIFALTVFTTHVLFWFAFYLKSGRVGVSTLASFLLVVIASSRIAIIRPEIFGTLCVAILLVIMAWSEKYDSIKSNLLPEDDLDHSLKQTQKIPKTLLISLYFGIPLIFLAWANLHGSFVVGLAILGLQFLGRVIEVGWRTRSLIEICSDKWVRRWLVVTELSVCGALLNPYHIDLFINSLTFPRNPNLKDVLEWEPLEFRDAEGIWFCASWVLMLGLFRRSREAIRTADVLRVGLLSLAVIIGVRMIGWFSVVFVYAMVPHLANVMPGKRQQGQSQATGTSEKMSFWAKKSPVITAFCVLIIWFGFAFSNIATPLFGGTPRKIDKIYSQGTPRKLTEFLKLHPPQGQVWNPQWWGDWLVWDGPPGMNVFMTTNAVHLSPPRVWKDYLGIARANRGWQSAAEKYNVSTFIVHKEKQVKLDEQVRRLKGFEIVYEDDLGIVVTREPKLISAVKEKQDSNKTAADKSESEVQP
ncbi:MAG: hypothetical protein K0U86_16460 [Planctomycetes bacterium]|nr:hypothetical protein [Planctomycetota bacterium]MCH9726494.1 hypothetical protein [Planctomycetota bacterium]MCH9778303.1 hypothetical protein [Planctomycetota bacterium]MCH9791480.1 hypothetical protein [Planctomycetota bacterium]